MYDADARVQHLLRMVALCPACHGVKHYGRTAATGYESDALGQLCRVNRWSRRRALRYVDQALTEWQKLCEIKWKVDLSVLADVYGLNPHQALRPRVRPRRVIGFCRSTTR